MLSSQDSVARFIFNSSVKTYDFSFPFWDSSQIEVYITVDGQDTLVDPANYTVTVPGNSGSVVLKESYNAPAGATNLTIARSVPLTQEMDFRNGDPINADNIETAYDTVTAMVQQVDEKVSRAIQLPISEEGQTYIMPSKSDRADMVLGFTADGSNFKVFQSTETAIAQADDIADRLEAAVQTNQGIYNYIKSVEDYIQASMRYSYTAYIGDGTSRVYSINHGLGTADIIMDVQSTDEDGAPLWSAYVIDGNNVTITFEEVIEANSAKVCIISTKTTPDLD